MFKNDNLFTLIGGWSNVGTRNNSLSWRHAIWSNRKRNGSDRSGNRIQSVQLWYASDIRISRIQAIQKKNRKKSKRFITSSKQVWREARQSYTVSFTAQILSYLSCEIWRKIWRNSSSNWTLFAAVLPTVWRNQSVATRLRLASKFAKCCCQFTDAIFQSICFSLNLIQGDNKMWCVDQLADGKTSGNKSETKNLSSSLEPNLIQFHQKNKIASAFTLCSLKLLWKVCKIVDKNRNENKNVGGCFVADVKHFLRLKCIQTNVCLTAHAICVVLCWTCPLNVYIQYSKTRTRTHANTHLHCYQLRSGMI